MTKLNKALCKECQNKNSLQAMHQDCVNELSRRQINRFMRQEDQSDLFPINNRFNVTERAIRRIQRLQREGLAVNDGLEYFFALEGEISNIVNDPNL